ncbi:Ras-related protein Rab6 [Gryllus bimaculatus]|nr:Ras-related protein Rab6 [Gryllus bimaculatus]
MLQSRSSTFKMMQNEVKADRQITSFPKPYRSDATPYSGIDFDPYVKETCCSSTSLVAGLTIAKVIILGDVAVGKTSLVNRFCHEIFDSNYKATIGVDFEVEQFNILKVPFNLQIWDTAGQERFKSIASSYYRRAHGQTLLQTSPKAFSEMESRGMKVAAELGAELWCVSSRTGERVTEMFHRVAALTFNSTFPRGDERIKQVALGGNLMAFKNPSKMSHQKCVSCN